MKNLHVIPTPNPSRIISSNKEFTLLKNYTTDKRCQNIYITSDEEIKEGEENEWYYDTNFNKITKWIGESNTYVNRWFKKIILTTDKSLDGVQAIDDEFLEWFVKNPSCEEVDVNKSFGGTYYIVYPYKIIIPKDYSKIKEGLEKSIKGKKHFVQHFKNGGTVEDFKPTEEDCSCTDECLGYLTKTCKGIETLEEFTKEVLEDEFFTNISEYKKAERLIEIGAKWEQERMYSEEEVYNIVEQAIKENSNKQLHFFDGGYSNPIYTNLQEWFNKFKKK